MDCDMAYTLRELEEISGLMQGMVSALKKPNFDPAHWTTLHVINQTPIQEIRDWVDLQIHRREEDLLSRSHDALERAAAALESFKGTVCLDDDLIALLNAVAERKE